MSGIKKCPHCGAEINLDTVEDLVCPECGADFTEDELEEEDRDFSEDDEF